MAKVSVHQGATQYLPDPVVEGRARTWTLIRGGDRDRDPKVTGIRPDVKPEPDRPVERGERVTDGVR